MLEPAISGLGLWLREPSGPLRANGSVWAEEACSQSRCWRVINVGRLPSCSRRGRGPQLTVACWASEQPGLVSMALGVHGIPSRLGGLRLRSCPEFCLSDRDLRNLRLFWGLSVLLAWLLGCLPARTHCVLMEREYVTWGWCRRHPMGGPFDACTPWGGLSLLPSFD